MIEKTLASPLYLVGIVFMIAYLIMQFFPPKKINHLYGYRTPLSKKSQLHWDFAQKYATKIMFLTSITLLLIGYVFSKISLSESTNIILSIAIIILSAIIMLVIVERKIKKQFPN